MQRIDLLFFALLTALAAVALAPPLPVPVSPAWAEAEPIWATQSQPTTELALDTPATMP